MTAKTLKTKTITAQEQAITDTQDRVTELETLVSALHFELDELTVERDALQERYSTGHDCDVDRLAELAENLIPRREARLETLESDTLPEAKRDAERAVLLEVAGRDADGIVGKHDAYLQAVAAAEAKVTQALADARAAADEWSTFINGVSESAVAAGLSDSRHMRGDDVEHPISYRASANLGYQPRTEHRPVTFAGETYAAVNADGAVRDIVSQADGHLRRLTRAAVDADIVAEGQRVQALTAHR